ncbi:MAG: 2-hydroxyacid dehydrogenase [Pseudomonadota bacterium]
MPTVLVQGRIAAPKVDLMRRFAPDGWTVDLWDPGADPVEAFAPLAANADVIVGGAIPTDWPETPDLKLFQIPWTGYDFTAPEKMPKGVPVANTFEHETAIAEYVLAGMLEWQIGLSRLDRSFRENGWGGEGPGNAATHGELMGRTLGIIGYGHIGEETARRARAFGMRCIGIRRSKVPCPEELDWIGQNDRMNDLLAEADFVLVACDMNDETIDLIGAAELAQMKPTGVVINVARGRIINEDALYNALNDKEIGGAIIDVWYNYNQPGQPDVWPCNQPFQDLDNVILSAHRSAVTEEMHERRWQFVAENCARIGRGEAPLNVVFHGTRDTAGG